MSRSSAARNSTAPLPWETRLTVMPSASAARSTASSTLGPSTLGISMRNAAPSGKEVPWSRPVTPSMSSTSATQLIAAPLEKTFYPERTRYSTLPKLILYIRVSGDTMTRQRKDHCQESLC